MTRFYTDKEALSIPWVESPFFYELLENSDLSDEEKEIATHYHEEGYVGVDLELGDDFIEAIKKDILARVSSEDFIKQAEGYHYSDSPRVFEGWKFSQGVLDLARHEKVQSTLKFLYGRDPIPFQTINFIKGTQQPLHSDSLHFYTQPEGWMVGVWTALEDIDASNGALQYVPKSHKLPHIEFPDLNLEVPEYNKEISNYRVYEEYVDKLVDACGLTREIFEAKKGEVFIWAPRLLHGAIPIKDNNRTRWSQATHYFFPDCDHYYTPAYSNRLEGQYSHKDLSEKDIMNHVLADA